MAEGVEFYCDYLIKLGVGDPYRLEHIKQHYIQHNSLWSADEKYLEHLKKKYIHNVENPPEKTTTNFPTADKAELTSDDSQPKKIHCWKCGGKNDGSAKFCNHCAHPLKEVGAEKKLVSKKTVDAASYLGGSKKKFIIIAVILVCVVIGGGAAMYGGDIDFGKSIAPKTIEPITSSTETTETDSTGETNSKCGPGTVYDKDTNTCTLVSVTTEVETDSTETDSTGETNSKCGPGTVYDKDTNTCVLADETNTETHSKCGPGTAYDPESNSCVLI